MAFRYGLPGGGEKKTLRIAAKYAAYTNYDGTPEGFARKSALLAEHCREVGTDFGAITRSANYNLVIGDTAADVAAKLEWIRAHLAKYVPADVADGQIQMLSSGPLVGTPEQVTEKLTELNGLGMTYAILNIAEVAYDRSSLDLFTQKVMPALGVVRAFLKARPRKRSAGSPYSSAACAIQPAVRATAKIAVPASGGMRAA